MTEVSELLAVHERMWWGWRLRQGGGRMRDKDTGLSVGPGAGGAAAKAGSLGVGGQPAAVRLRHHPSPGNQSAALSALDDSDWSAFLFYLKALYYSRPFFDDEIGNGGGLASTAKDDGDEQELVSVAGVGSAVFFRGSYPFALQDWQSIKRYI
ncbi:hypothetical protein BHM03_00051910 [Ensete ventricosum]|nr:hypothetical protein BHM03_00051910 [Ensete ventricosum]